MSTITVKTNIAKVLSELDTFQRKQVPFASAKTLNDLAFGARDETRKNLGQYFEVRTTWVERGIRVGKFAKKREWPHQSSSVGSVDEFMALHALGGTKTGNGGDLAVPIEARQQIGRKNGTLPRSTWPSRVKGRRRGGNRNKIFVQKLRRGPSAGLNAVMRRDTQDRYPLQVLYILKPSVKIQKTWHFETDATNFVRTNYAVYFGKALAKALATAR